MISSRPSSIFTRLARPQISGLTAGWFYVEIERLSLHELLFVVRFYVLVYVFVRCVSGAISPILVSEQR